MNLDFNGNKGFRLLDIYERLNKGEAIRKADLVHRYDVSDKTIQRDIDDLRAYLAETHSFEQEVAIQYNRRNNSYYLVRMDREWLTSQEVLALCKVLLESRAFCKSELDQMVAKLLTQVTPNDRKQVEEMIRKEQFTYVPLAHGKELLSPIWELSQYINQSEVIEVAYTRKDGVSRSHRVKPVAILFSEYYFYLIAYMADDSKDFPTVFRIDRLGRVTGTGEKFRIPYRDKFDDGEFRKRVQFMFSGPLKTVLFTYTGPSIEAVLDRLPTAEVLGEQDGAYEVKAEVYGDGIDMWLRSQGNYVTIIEKGN